MRLILWDIDGTVMRAGASTRDGFATAVARVVGVHPGEHGVAMSGKTDPQIALEILDAMGLDAAAAAGYLPAVLDHLQSELASRQERMASQGRLMPGVETLLARLDAEPAVVQTVLTGNIAANAAVKLAAFGLDRWLDLRLGAFGSDDPDRCALVPVALQRLRRLRGHEPDVVWVVGDTPNDLACARAGGARCLLVGTGGSSYADLAHEPADAVRADLSDTDEVAALLLG